MEQYDTSMGHEASSSASAELEKTLSKSLLECLRALVQLDPSLAQRDIGSGDSFNGQFQSWKTHFRNLLDMYEAWPSQVDVNGPELLSMVYEIPSELLMEVSPIYQRTILQMVVIANSETDVTSLLKRVIRELTKKENSESSDRRLEDQDHLSKNMQFLFAVERVSNFTAFQMACIIGNGRIIRMIEYYQKGLRKISKNKNKVRWGKYKPEARPLDEKGLGKARDLNEAGFIQPLTEESVQLRRRRRIGEILASSLQPVGFTQPLVGMPVGDEFKLHESIKMGDINTYISWNDYGKSKDIAGLLRSIISELHDNSLLSTFLQLRDNAGRNILHYLANLAPGNDTLELIFNTIMDELIVHDPELDMNVEDSVGRTPLHLAAAQGFAKRVEYFAKDGRINLNATFKMSSCWVDRDIKNMDDVEEISALSLAVRHNHFEVVRSLLKARNPLNFTKLNVNQCSYRYIKQNGGYEKRLWTPFQLAAFKGHVQTVEVLLADHRICDFGFIKGPQMSPNQDTTPDTTPALHLAALGGKPYAIKALLKSTRIDPLALDIEGNTALHYTTRLNFEDVYGPWDFVSIDQCFKYVGDDTKRNKNSAEIIGSMSLLLQTGLDMEQTNKQGNTPEFGPQIPEDVQQWWYDKLAREAQEAKNNVIAAANAISVTSALVAATSFVGPLQPPLGLSNSTDAENMWLLGYSQVNHVAVSIFLFFDSLSFYLAIASIMLALIPSLPIQHEGLFLQLKRAQRNLQGALALLFASITFLICTFGAASVVIIPKGRWKYKAIIISTAIFGGSICFVVLLLFLRRLWRLIKPKGHYL